MAKSPSHGDARELPGYGLRRLSGQKVKAALVTSFFPSLTLLFPPFLPPFPSLPSFLSQCLLNIFHMPRIVAFNHYGLCTRITGKHLLSFSPFNMEDFIHHHRQTKSVMNLTYSCNHHPIMSVLFHLCLYPLPIPQPGQTIGNPNHRHHLFFLIQEEENSSFFLQHTHDTIPFK